MKDGFTLIELLVVVLIIGILASIAVPQYKLVVEKSRIGQVLGILRATNASQERYYMANGQYATLWSQLDITPPTDKIIYGLHGSGDYAVLPNNWDLTVYDNGRTFALKNNAIGRPMISFNLTIKETACCTEMGFESEFWKRICQSLGATVETVNHISNRKCYILP